MTKRHFAPPPTPPIRKPAVHAPPPVAQMKFVDYDLKKFGSKEERTRLIGRWEREVANAPK